MRNKLFSLTLALIMVVTVCATPAMSDGPYATDGTSVLSDGNAYGIYIDLNDDTISKLFSDATGKEMDHDGVVDYLMDKLKALFAPDVDISGLEYDIDIDIGICLKQIESSANGYRYALYMLIDGKIDVSLENTSTVENYIGEKRSGQKLDEFVSENKSKAVASKEVVSSEGYRLEMRCSMDLKVSTDSSDRVLSVDGWGGFHSYKCTRMTSIKEYTDSDGTYTYLDNTSVEGHGDVLFETVTQTDGDDSFINMMGVRYADTMDLSGSVPDKIMMDSEDVELTIPRSEIENVIKIFNDETSIDGKITFVGLIRIIDNLSGNEFLKRIGEIIGIGPITDTGLETAIKYLMGFDDTDAIPLFIFGDDGIELSPSEVNRIERGCQVATKGVYDALKTKELKVEFLNEDGTPIDTISVHWGDTLTKSTEVMAAESRDNMTFIGWKAVSYYDEPIIMTGFSKVYYDMTLTPLFAEDVDDLNDLYVELKDNDKNLKVQLDNGRTMDLRKLLEMGDSTNVFVSVTSSGPAKSIQWMFRNGSAVESMDVGYTSSDQNGSIRIDFAFDGDLPSGTQICIDVGGVFKDGTVIDIFHLDGNGKRDAAMSGYIVVSDGKIVFSIQHCSSYLIQMDEEFTHFEPKDVPSEDEGKNGYTSILIGVMVIVAVGIGAFLYVRKK